jgi:acyl transferase domain-containing protein/NADP-dependent 3-hydroxy acid dehydrogenase YdfG/acyl carrier protein
MLTGNVDPGCLNRTAYAQPALFAVEYALAELWRSWGVEPAYVVGHSLGEFTAAAIAGIFDVEDALRLVARRGRLMQSLPGGGKMAAALAGEDRVRAALDGLGDVAIAALNSPESTVISGAAEAVEQAVERLERQGVSSQYLEVSHAFHSALMEPMLDAFEREVAALRMNAPRIPLVSNLSGELMTDDEATDPARWRRHAREPVRFAQSIRTLVGLGVRSFVEVGPHPTLCGLARATVRDHDIYLIPSLRRGVTAWQPLLDSVGTLYGIGYELEWQGLAREHAGRRTVGPTYPFQRKRHWFDVGRSSRPQALGAPPGAAAAHPLLGVSIDSPALRGRAFEITLTPRQPAYLAEHAVGDSVLTPGAVFVEMLAAAGREALGSDRVRLDRVRFEHPLFVSDDGVRCQVTVTEPRDGGAEALVSSGKAGPRGRIDWTRHASCTVQSSPAPESAPDELANLRRHVTAPIDVAALFDRIAARGIQHGPSFRALREAWSGPTGALGRAELHADSAAGAGYAGVHPCLLDSGLQLLECLSGDDVGSDATFLPAGIDEIRWYSAAGRCVWIHGSIRDQGPEPDPDLLLADLRFFDEEGRLVVDLVGFRARNVHLEPTRRADAASASVLTVGWEEIDAPSAPQPGTGVWLVLEDRSRVAAAVAAEIERRGGRVVRVRRGGAWAHEADGFTVDPDQPGQLARVMEASGLTGGAALTGLLHFWTLDRPDAVERSAAAVQREVLDGLSPLLDVVQSSSAWRGRIGLVTRGAAGDIGSRSASAWQAGAALWGAISVLQAEYPESLCRVLDLDPAVLSYEAGAILDAVLGDSAEDRLVVRDGKLLAPRLSALHEPSGEDLRRLPGSSYRIQIHQRGTLDGISYVRMPRVDPGPGEVEVRVRCTGLNFRDVLNVLGMYPGDPGDPGNEFAGVVTRLGPGVTGLAEGDAVIGIGSAAFAAYTIEPAAAVVRQPRGLSMVEAATIPLVFLTAEYGLMRLAGLNSGERVLIHAAAGGVGQAAVQIAQAAGAEVFATAGSDAKRDFLRAQGVRQVFSSRDPAFADEVFAATKGEGVDVVLNALTGPMLKRSLELLRPGGRFLEMGKAEVLDPAEVSATYSGVRYEAFDLGALLLSDPVAFQQMFLRLVERFESGELEPLHVRTFEAERIVDALRYMAQARHIGKVVVSGGRLAAADDPVIRSDGVYLVTGATGGVARAVVEWLVRRGAGSIVLSARSAPDDERAHWLDALRAEGARIDWVAGDVTSQADTAALIAAAVDTGLPLRGAFHLAGVLDDGLMADQTRDRFDRVLAPKVAGAWHLCQAVRRFELDHFVLFSSIAGVLGGAGQLSYSAANAVLGTLAEQLTREGISAVAIDWGAWDGPGMAAGISEPIRRRLIESGSGFVRPEAAIELMESVLSGSEAHVLIAQIDWQRLAASVRKAPPLLAHLLDGGAAVRASDNGGQRKPEQQTGADEPHTPMEQTIADLWRKLLKVDYVSVHDTFFDLGGDSLLSAEFVTMLEKAIGLRVDPADVIVQTLQQLAAVCEEKAPISAAPPQRQGTFVRRLLNQIKRTVS